MLCSSTGTCTSTTLSLWNQNHSLTYQSWKDCKFTLSDLYPKIPKISLIHTHIPSYKKKKKENSLRRKNASATLIFSQIKGFINLGATGLLIESRKPTSCTCHRSVNSDWSRLCLAWHWNNLTGQMLLNKPLRLPVASDNKTAMIADSGSWSSLYLVPVRLILCVLFELEVLHSFCSLFVE